MSHPFDPWAFIGPFVEEAKERLQSLNAALLALEKDAHAKEVLKEALRQAHTLKGSAKMLSLNDIAQVSHGMEDILVAVQEGDRPLPPETFDLLFRVVDVLSARVEQLARGEREPMDVSVLCLELDHLRGSLAQSPGKNVPVLEAPATRAGVQPSAPREGRPSGPEPGSAGAAQVRPSLRVSVDKIDQLANLSAEMMIQNLRVSERHLQAHRVLGKLRHFRDRLRDSAGRPGSGGNGAWAERMEDLQNVHRELRQFVEDLAGDQVRLNLITDELRQSVMDLTMLPLSTVFDAFPRTVRDLARQFGKDVDLTVRGGEAELDKKIIEALGDPLVHLLRNAIAHGIEPPERRERAGKSRSGQLLLDAAPQGNRILVTVRDDGEGIDPKVIRAAAVNQDLVRPGDLERWSDEEVLNLIFEPGFSTSRTLTDLSGRGVGMDAVKSAVEHLNGTVRLHSEVGVGTSVVLDLPLSLALLRGIVVQTGSELFVVPSSAVEQIVSVEQPQILHLQQGQAIEFAGETVAVVPLGNVLEVASAGAAQPPWPVIVGHAFGRRFGLLVDGVLPEQEFVFKELPGSVREQKLFSGATILGDGRIVLILEIHGVFQSASRGTAVRAAVAAEEAAEAVPASILVVEDSLITGELERNILQGAGYRAEIAHDGIHALEMLRDKRYDLVVADVDMPRMDGFELTARMRAEDRLREIPVVIVTARESDDDRRRGIEVGADAYIMKREFDQSQLLETIRRLVGR